MKISVPKVLLKVDNVRTRVSQWKTQVTTPGVRDSKCARDSSSKQWAYKGRFRKCDTQYVDRQTHYAFDVSSSQFEHAFVPPFGGQDWCHVLQSIYEGVTAEDLKEWTE